MQIINVRKIQNTTVKFLEYGLILMRPISSLTPLEIKPIQFALKKKKKSLEQMK